VRHLPLAGVQAQKTLQQRLQEAEKRLEGEALEIQMQTQSSLVLL
jgi:hypothetical protein